MSLRRSDSWERYKDKNNNILYGGVGSMTEVKQYTSNFLHEILLAALKPKSKKRKAKKKAGMKKTGKTKDLDNGKEDYVLEEDEDSDDEDK